MPSLFSGLLKRIARAVVLARGEQLPASPPVTASPPPGDKDIQEFLWWGQWLPVVSSNVARIRYNPDRSLLTVQFLVRGEPGTLGNAYEYEGVAPGLAYAFAVSASKGHWVWENLRWAGVAYRLIFGTVQGKRPGVKGQKRTGFLDRLRSGARRRGGR